MAFIAGVRNLKRFGVAGRHEVESVTSNILVCDRLRNLGHMTGDAFVAGAARLMVRVRLNRGRVRSRLCVRAVTVKA